MLYKGCDEWDNLHNFSFNFMIEVILHCPVMVDYGA